MSGHNFNPKNSQSVAEKTLNTNGSDFNQSGYLGGRGSNAGLPGAGGTMTNKTSTSGLRGSQPFSFKAAIDELEEDIKELR